MNASRLNMLARRHAMTRFVVAYALRPDGTTLTLSCGHKGECAPHFDTLSIKTWECSRCGEAEVRNSPHYASEF